MMPSPSDSSRSLTSRPSTRGLTHLRLHRPWLQALLTLGLAQVLLGILVITFSMVASSVTTTESIKRSCPSWAGFSLAFSGLVGIVSWKRPFTLVISFFSLLSVLCVMLSMAGSVLSCKNAQLARDFRECSMEGKVCVCCPPIPLHRPCPEWGQELKVALNSTCDEARGALKNLLFSVCGLTICAAIICTLSAIVCCVQIFSLDLVHMLAPERSVSGPLGPLACTSSPPAPLLHTMLDLEEFVPPVPPPPYYPPEYTCSSETDAQRPLCLTLSFTMAPVSVSGWPPLWTCPWTVGPWCCLPLATSPGALAHQKTHACWNSRALCAPSIMCSSAPSSAAAQATALAWTAASGVPLKTVPCQGDPHGLPAPIPAQPLKPHPHWVPPQLLAVATG
uniref:Endosomal transmembrane epsin interactor 3 n=1 Tax=Mus musculus TaxID=10090 RepID=D6RFB2_MOUSE